MKTLLFTLEYPPFKGGVADVYEKWVKYWPEPENIHVLHNQEGGLLDPRFKPAWLAAFLPLYRAIKKYNINHVLVGHILPLGTVAWIMSFFFNYKYAVVLHGMDLDLAIRTKRKKWLSGKILKKADRIIAMNSYVKKRAEEFLDIRQDNSLLAGKGIKLVMANPGVELTKKPDIREIERINSKYGLEGKFVVFSLGRLVKRKGQDKTIEAVKKLVEKHPDICYYIAGAGPDEQYLRGLAKDCENIVFLGKISEREKWAWLSQCDVFAMASRGKPGDYEGFGIVYLEAGLMAAPVLAGDSGGVRDAVAPDETGILIDPESADSIADGIMDYYHNWHLRYDLGLGGTERVIRHFDARRQVKKIFDIIENIQLKP